MTSRKTLRLTIWVFCALLFTSVSYSSEPEKTHKDLAEKFNAILEAAFETGRDGRNQEAYEITAQLETLCENGTCDPDHVAKIRGDFLYELSRENAWTLSRTGDYLGAVKIMEPLEPRCVFLKADGCVEEHDWFLNTMQLMAVRKDVKELVEINKFREASAALSKARRFATALPEKDQIEYRWDLAGVYAFYNSEAAVAEVRDLVQARKLRPFRPVDNYLRYLGWLVNAGESQELSGELVRFFETCRKYGGFLTALPAGSSSQDRIYSLDLLLASLENLNTGIEDVVQALIDASSLEDGEVRSRMLKRAGDLALIKSGKERLATELYRESGLTATESDRRRNLAKLGTLSLDAASTSEPDGSLEALTEVLREASTSGSDSKSAFYRLAQVWDSQSSAAIESDPARYAGATIALAMGAPTKETRDQVLSDGYFQIADRLSALQQQYRRKELVAKDAYDLELHEYVVLLDLAKLRAATFGLNQEQLELSMEQLSVRESLFGHQSYQLLASLSSAAHGASALGNADSFTGTFSRAKSLEANGLLTTGQCNLGPFRFSYPFDYATRALDQQKIEDWFLSEGEVHLANAKKFIGIEKQYQCMQSVRQLLSEYLFITDGQSRSLEMIYKLSQVTEISDLLISTELGIEKLRTDDPDLLARLADYGQVSKNINAPDRKVEADSMLENFLEYTAEKTAIYEQVRARSPDVASLMVAEGMSVSETQESLADGEALLYYTEIPAVDGNQKAGGTESIYYLLFIATNQDFHLLPLRLTSPENLTRNLQRMRRSLDQGVSRASNLSPFDLEAAKYVFDTLVKPGMKSLESNQRLFIVTSPSLAGLPFELLPISNELPSVRSFVDFRKYREVSWMNDRYSISYLSSPRMLGRRNNSANASDSKFLGIGNPEFSPPAMSPTVSQRDSSDSRSSTALERVLARDYKSLSAEGSVASSLPESQLIIDSMARRYGPLATVLTGASATESQISQLDLSQYSTIAFATHGLLDATVSPEPALLLGYEPDTSGGSVFDGLLTSREVIRMNLSANLIVLAACNSATKARIDGVVSLANSFLTAGSASVVASHWAVDVNATARLFDAFAQHREAAPNTNSADHLQRARIELLRQNKNQLYAHPVFWGGFATYGF
ncbi:CHAT domain-containing protein [Congregibacter litoralis]|uniref:CHAT domain-containing protein n=1 Tax=Congregibacter litoralis KT71 TaxID=314285 RepID=A4AD58_9GAMM|nr:CHAT domain-containing protein [Congregibacter litoralis]EAQ96111.1 hypothetical protein KT71_08645 [Congregibacter litoralis KT71]